jgi:hypothetical protein
VRFFIAFMATTQARRARSRQTLLIQVLPDPSVAIRRRYGARMDTRSEVREFLTTRRARIRPEQAGLRTYGTGSRRVPGLRREEVALLAGVSVDYYTRLERGNANGVSTPRRRRRGQQRVRPAVQQMLDAMTRPPMQLARNSPDAER